LVTNFAAIASSSAIRSRRWSDWAAARLGSGATISRWPANLASALPSQKARLWTVSSRSLERRAGPARMNELAAFRLPLRHRGQFGDGVQTEEPAVGDQDDPLDGDARQDRPEQALQRCCFGDVAGVGRGGPCA
jgi:hypothetical protein